jgi:hypothetical protein
VPRVLQFSEEDCVLRESITQCRYRLSWNLDEKRFELIISEGEKDCLLISSLPLPLLEAKKDLDTRELKSHGYTYANLYSSEQLKLSNQIRLSYTCKYDKIFDECSYALINEETWVEKNINDIIETAVAIIDNKKLKGLIIQAGFNEDYFYRFFERNNTTLITFLFNKGFFEKIGNRTNVYVATKGLITHNDIQVALENEVGIIYCIDLEGHFLPMIPMDYIIRNDGKLYLSCCRINGPMPIGFLIGHAARLLFSYYRKKIILSDSEVLSTLYSWWKEVDSHKYPPDYLVYDKPRIKNLKSPSLIELMNLGYPAEALIYSRSD